MGSLLSRAGLGRAVTNTVRPVGSVALAGDIVGSAVELGLGNAVHVVDAVLLEAC